MSYSAHELMLASLPDDQAARAAATHEKRKRQETVRNIVPSLPDSYFAEQGMTSANMENFARGMQTAMELRHAAQERERIRINNEEVSRRGAEYNRATQARDEIRARTCPQIEFRSSDPAYA
jgi:hypothetical protein